MSRPDTLAVAVLLILALGCASSSYDDSTRTEAVVTTGRDTRAPVERGAITDGTAILATNGELYRLEGSRTTAVARQPEPGAQLVLAPGGRFYAWVRARATERDVRSLIDLVETDTERKASWQTEPAPGSAELHLGLDGKLILTLAPLVDPEGTRGPFRYTFWDREGRALRSLDFDRANVVLAADGSAVLLLGQTEALACSASGQELWRVRGQYRKAALSSATGPALLNPGERGAIDQIVIVSGGGEQRRTQLPTPVHRLAISPDGATAAAAGDRGSYFFIDVGAASVGERRESPSRTGVPYIFDLEVAGPDTLLLGILHRLENQSWPSASVVAVQRDGRVTFTKSVPIREAVSGVPDIDIRYGANEFIAHTRETAFRGRIDGRP